MGGIRASSALQLHGVFLPGARDSWAEVPASVGPSWARDLCTIRLRRLGAGRPIEPCLWQCGSRLQLGPLGQGPSPWPWKGRLDWSLAEWCWCITVPLARSGGPGLPVPCRTWLSVHPAFQLLTPGAAGPKGAGTGPVPACFLQLRHHRQQTTAETPVPLFARIPANCDGGEEQENRC